MPGLIFAAIIFKTTTRWTLTPRHFCAQFCWGWKYIANSDRTLQHMRPGLFHRQKKIPDLFPIFLPLASPGKSSIRCSLLIPVDQLIRSSPLTGNATSLTPSKLIRLSQSASAFQVIQRNDCKLSWQD